MKTPFQADGDRRLLTEDLTEGGMVRENRQPLDLGDGVILLGPGGHKVDTKLIGAMAAQVAPPPLTHLLFSRRDPDVVAAAQLWRLVKDPAGYLSGIWLRLSEHFGAEDPIIERVRPVCDPVVALPFAAARGSAPSASAVRAEP